MNIAWGENPVVECEEKANAAPQNLVDEDRFKPTAAVTLLAKVVHLFEEKSGN